MSITQDLRTRARHRGMTPWQLVQKIGRLEREADDRTCQLVTMATEIDELKAERNALERQLDEAGIDLSGTLEDLRQTRAENQLLRAELANRNAVTVRPMERDTSDGADEATEPIRVVTLQQAFGSTDPAHVPAWATRD